jgi:hypothetical protein
MEYDGILGVEGNGHRFLAEPGVVSIDSQVERPVQSGFDQNTGIPSIVDFVAEVTARSRYYAEDPHGRTREQLRVSIGRDRSNEEGSE